MGMFSPNVRRSLMLASDMVAKQAGGDSMKGESVFPAYPPYGHFPLLSGQTSDRLKDRLPRKTMTETNVSCRGQKG